MVLPTGIDRDTLVPDLLAQMADYEILYPDLDTVKTVLASWSQHRLPVWERIVKAANTEYDPIENYDRREEWTDQGSASGNANQKEEFLYVHKLLELLTIWLYHFYLFCLPICCLFLVIFDVNIENLFLLTIMQIYL